MNGYILALDQGTTSSRAILFDAQGAPVTKAQYPLPQHYPSPGWVEHDPMEILSTQLMAAAQAFEKSGLSPTDVAGIGLTNQRETTLVWDRETGLPVMNAIVWQCRRTAPLCDRLKAEGMTDYIRQTTGLIPDAYFSGTKIRWILDHVPGAQQRAREGKLLCGTVDSWLIWNLTGEHLSDVSNCSRTMLFDIHRLAWDETLCRRLDIPMCMLPRPVSNSECYGHLRPGIRGLEDLAGVPVCGAAGDQQAALFGQCCFAPGQVKNTYGTGCFTLMNTGNRPAISQTGLLTSVAWQLGGQVSYALEGSVFNAGSAIQWLRDELGLIGSASECDRLAESVADNGGVYLVPAFTGLGAPEWDMYARGAILGLTRGANRAHLARATLESIAYQVADLVHTMSHATGCPVESLWVDGGAAVSDFLMQFQADVLRCSIHRPQMVETTAAGAAYLAGLAVGLWQDTGELVHNRRLDRSFTPQLDLRQAADYTRHWHKAVERAKKWEESEHVQ